MISGEESSQTSGLELGELGPQWLHYAAQRFESFEESSELLQLVEGHILKVNGFHSVLYAVCEYFSSHLLNVQQLPSPGSELVSLELERHQVFQCIQTHVYFLNIHQGLQQPFLHQTFAKWSLAVVQIVKQGSL